MTQMNGFAAVDECQCPSYYCPEDAALADFCPVHGTFFDEMEAMAMEAPQRIVTLGLDDRVYWKDKEGNISRLAEMETSHLQNIQRFLDRRAEGLFLKYAMSIISSLPDDDCGNWWSDEIVDDLAETKASTWLHRRPLWLAISTELNKRARS